MKEVIINKMNIFTIKKMSKKRVFLLWCFFDCIYIAWYFIQSLLNGNIPYISDAISLFDVVFDKGDDFFEIYGVFSFVFQISIILSAFMLWRKNDKAKILCYLQIPFRLFLIVPSISFILIFISYFDSYNIAFILCLVVFSEMLKFITLWKSKDIG